MMTSLTYSKATIFGAGQVGMTLMEQLVQQGVAVTLVNRRGQVGEPLPAGATIVAGDLTDAEHCSQAGKGCRSCLCHGAAGLHAVARKVAAVDAELDWRHGTDRCTAGLCRQPLYVWPDARQADPRGSPLRGDRAQRQDARQIATMLLDAHKAGKVRATIGRASDFFGPRATDTAIFGDRFFAAALAGKPADLFGNPDLPHTYTYVPDFAAGADQPEPQRGSVRSRLARAERTDGIDA